MNSAFYASLTLIAVALLFGCAKKDDGAEASAKPAAHEKTADDSPSIGLPGAKEVQAALKAGNYASAVEQLVALKPLAIGDVAWAEYRELSGEVGLKLAEAAKTDPKAAEALATYQLTFVGR
jgi:hypothetical protein